MGRGLNSLSQLSALSSLKLLFFLSFWLREMKQTSLASLRLKVVYIWQASRAILISRSEAHALCSTIFTVPALIADLVGSLRHGLQNTGTGLESTNKMFVFLWKYLVSTLLTG